MIEEIKTVKFKCPEDMVFRIKSTHDDFLGKLDKKSAKTTGDSIPPCKITDPNLLIESLFPVM